MSVGLVAPPPDPFGATLPTRGREKQIHYRTANLPPPCGEGSGSRVGVAAGAGLLH